MRIIKAVERLPKSTAGFKVDKQMFLFGTSAAANYSATYSAKSKKDFIYSLEVVAEEADKTLFWLELLSLSKILPSKKLQPLMDEANQLISVFTKSIKTVKQKVQELKQ
ncbi:MAG: four helix bundle protein [Chitinophagales bacterium]|nr:four helix bundle protein [Chitinophagales bacterium]